MKWSLITIRLNDFCIRLHFICLFLFLNAAVVIFLSVEVLTAGMDFLQAGPLASADLSQWKYSLEQLNPSIQLISGENGVK